MAAKARAAALASVDTATSPRAAKIQKKDRPRRHNRPRKSTQLARAPTAKDAPHNEKKCA